MNIPTKEENRFLNYLEEYIVKLEKEKTNSIGKIDLPGFSVFGIHESIIISKSYGFIQWLVDNDKIDRESENYPLKKHSPYFNDDVLAIVSQDCNTYEDKCRVYYDNYESLLMLLSISDTPIEDLISYLK